MLLPIEIASVNHRRLLKSGRYDARCLTFVSTDATRSVLQFEYRRVGDELISAVDVLFVDADGGTRMADFLRMPDRSWRDNFGARADSLLALLPPEIAEYELVDEVELGAQIVEAGL
ncbi:hypothetical protein [Burkholderia sp. BE17]|uniref:hypothetical protein n=1 Tax=Burkholderia sp. BE17 TaxID=2656644 RepID=UPI00128D6F2D|nr:hypothetical protein [Burkholderia sp. BE17]MPV65641.1 hypothetical protein [Burkholderia sp. BE17]